MSHGAFGEDVGGVVDRNRGVFGGDEEGGLAAPEDDTFAASTGELLDDAQDLPL